jgi:alpha-beta hydrolase superfamily lysophospholipase
VGADALSLEWRPDVLGGDFEAAALAVGSTPPGSATLVRLCARGRSDPGRCAVLYVHGYNDYFFQADLARWFDQRGLDFYAVDLRDHGRSMVTGRVPNYVADLDAYDGDLDAALAAILGAGHERVVIVAHSTGGLIAPLWAARRPRAPIAGLALNSPFLEFKQPAAVRGVASAVASVLGRYRPLLAVPAGVDSVYGDSLHVSRRGEWDYDLAWKPSPGFAVRLGWLRAVIEAHSVLHGGLDLRVPALVMSSTRTVTARAWSDEVRRGDVVLDADAVARWAPAIGRNVTVVRIEDGMHDLFLSGRPARDRAYDALGTWLSAWVLREPTPS